MNSESFWALYMGLLNLQIQFRTYLHEQRQLRIVIENFRVTYLFGGIWVVTPKLVMPPFLSHVLLMSVSLWGSHAVSRRIFIGTTTKTWRLLCNRNFHASAFSFIYHCWHQTSQRVVIPFNPKPNSLQRRKTRNCCTIIIKSSNHYQHAGSWQTH